MAMGTMMAPEPMEPMEPYSYGSLVEDTQMGGFFARRPRTLEA